MTRGSVLCVLLCAGCVEFDAFPDARDASTGDVGSDGGAAHSDGSPSAQEDGEDESQDGDFAGDGTSSPGDGSAGDGDGAPAGDGSSDGDGEPVDPAEVLFAEDFEGTADDAVPAGFHSFVSYQVDANNTKSSNAYALVDQTKAHGGVKALHVKGGGSPAMITRALPDGTNALYVRVFAFLTGSLGQAPSRNHETLLGVRKSVGGANDEVRFGEIKGVIGVNEVPSDNISPKMDQWGGGPLITSGAWHCIEVAFRGDLPSHEVRAWNDGEEVFVVNQPTQWQNGELSPTFLDGKFVEFILGWHSFSNYENELWLDDLVVARSRVGCP